MFNIKKIAIVLLISFQVIIILSLIVFNYNRGRSVLGRNNFASTVDKNTVKTFEVAGLEHFYETDPNLEIEESLPWDRDTKVVYKTNSEGFNQIDNVPLEKQKNTFRIAILGDSFTYGKYVNTEDNYPSVLNNKLRNECKNMDFEILNLGEGGYDITYAVTRYIQRGKKYDPELLLFLIIEDDLWRINELLKPRSDSLLYQMQQSGEYEKAVENGNFYPHWHKAREEIIKEVGKEKIFSTQYDYLKKLSDNFSNNIVLFTLVSTDDGKKVLQDFSKIRKGIYLEEISINVDNYPDLHPSPNGHEQLADYMFNYLINNELINC